MTKNQLTRIILDHKLQLVKLTRNQILSEIWVIDLEYRQKIPLNQQRIIFNSLLFSIVRHPDNHFILEGLTESTNPVQVVQFSNNQEPIIQLIFNPSISQILVYILDSNQLLRKK